MTSATVAGDGAGCCAEASAMIRSLEDPIALLLGIRSHRWARGGVRLVAFGARMRWDGPVGSCDDVNRFVNRTLRDGLRRGTDQCTVA